MSTSSKFTQINPFVNRLSHATNAAHLSWMERFTDRVNTLIVTVLGQDCPALISQSYTALAAALQYEDDCYKIITRSELSDQIREADQVRDNTYIGLRTMIEALQRVGTAQQKESATRVLLAMKDYGIRTDARYEVESTNIAQLIQQLEGALSTDCTTLGLTALVSQLKTENQTVIDLISQRNEEQAGVDPSALRTARQQSDAVYTEAVMIINAFAITQWEVGQSPYDHAIDVVNQDQDYYIQHVFSKPKFKKVKIGDDLYFYFTGSETWGEAIEEHPEENEGWSVSVDDEVIYQDQRLLDADDQPVAATAKPDETAVYHLEEASDGGDDVTPVTPE